jgi:hypothetical protein
LKDYIICLDSDGVFADIKGYAKSLGHPRIDSSVWSELSTYPRFFYNLPLLPDALELYDAVKHLEHYVLTAAPRPTGYFTTAQEDKKAWWDKYVAEITVVVTPGVKKYLHAAPNKVLIDDHTRNIRMWKEAGGIGILHTSTKETLIQLKELKII